MGPAKSTFFARVGDRYVATMNFTWSLLISVSRWAEIRSILILSSG